MRTQGAARPAWDEAGPLTLAACPRFVEAADKFVADNSSFESSAVGEAVRRDLEKAASLHAAALVPLRHKVFGFDSALKWSFFLHTAAGRFFGEDAGEELPATFRDPALWPPFEPGKFYGEMAAIYDLAVEAAVWDHCASDSEEDDDDDDDGDDDDGDGEDADGGEPAAPRESRRGLARPESPERRRRGESPERRRRLGAD